MSTYLDLKNAIIKDGLENGDSIDDIKLFLDFVDDKMDDFRKYFNAVYEHVIGAESARLLLNGGMIDVEKYKDRIIKLDGDRKHAHDMAIDACNKLNRQCDAYKVEHFCPTPELAADGSKYLNRGEIADFVGKFVYETYQRGRGRTDMEIEAVMKQYDIKYGDRTFLDAAFTVAEEDARNPEKAYEKEADNQFLVEYNEVNSDDFTCKSLDTFEEAKLFVDNLPDTVEATIEAIEVPSLTLELDDDFDIDDR